MSEIGAPAPTLKKKSLLRRVAIGTFLVAALGYSAILGTLYVYQDKMVFAALPGLSATPNDAGLTYDEVQLEVGTERTHGWFLPAKNARGVILFSHGNGGNVGGWYKIVPFYHELGLSVLVYDYAGYGNSTGEPSEERIYKDVRAMWDWLTLKRHIPADKIILVGRSLGGGPTLELANKVKPAGVVLEGTFSSIPDQAAKMFPWLPVRSMLQTEFANKDKVGKIGVPILIFHSKDDELIPFAHSELLFALAKEPKTLVPISGDHNTGFRKSADITGPAWKTFADHVLGLTPLP